ncbi:uncharacterized protein LOC143253850 isoform X2 [Tachypleus tridentatus]
MCEELLKNPCTINEKNNDCSLICEEASEEMVENVLQCVREHTSCKLTELTLKGPISLEKFEEVVPHITKLYLVNGDAGKIKRGIKLLNLSNLNYLHIRNSSLHVITGDLFQNMKKLKNLDLLDDKIVSIKDDAFRMLRNSLITLSLEGNALKGIPEAVNNLNKVQIISLKNNEILELHSNVTLPNLKQLILTNNKMSEIHSLGNFEKLENLYLDLNKIVYVEKSVLSNTSQLKTIYLNNNKIETLSSTFCTETLENLYCQNNAITNITSTFSKSCSNLKILDVSENFLPELETSTLPCETLNTLKLGHNSISSIKRRLFSDCSKLITLELQNNEITSIPRESFPEKLWNNINLTITNNPFKCTCSLDWIKQYLIQIYQLNDTGHCTNYNNMQFSEIEFCLRNTTLDNITKSTEEIWLPTPTGNLVTSGGTTQKPISLDLSVESVSDRELLVKWNPKYFSEMRRRSISTIQINCCDTCQGNKIAKLVSSESGNTKISNLKEFTNYDVCLSTSENVIKCETKTTNLKPENETFIAKKHKHYFIIISIVVIVLSLGLGYLLRKMIEQSVSRVEINGLKLPHSTTNLGLADSFRDSVSTNSYLSVPENLPPGCQPSSFSNASFASSSCCTQPRAEYPPVCDTDQHSSHENDHTEDWKTTSQSNTTLSTSNTNTSTRNDSAIGFQNLGFTDYTKL